MRKYILILFVLISISLDAQKIKLYGTITNIQGEYLPGVVVRSVETNTFTTSDFQGYYELKLPQNKNLKIVYSYVMAQSDTVNFYSSQSTQKDIVLQSDHEVSDVYVIANQIDEGGMERISTKNLTVLPDVSGNSVLTLVKTGMGVSSNNELSSQYNVRGGNFDENLIYVNDILIYRPLLIRSGQQEGLSFINSDLTGSIKFSAGGFDAKYDDKMSSVLDIKYKTPTEFAASASISLLGGTAHIENISKNKKLTYILGFRHKQMKYLLNTLEAKGDYQPAFTDFQFYTTYKINRRLSFSFLGNIASNIYTFIPKSKNESTGTFNQSLGISTYYEGLERDTYRTFFGAISAQYNFSNNFSMKLISSSYYTIEAEKYDIDAYYSLNQLNKSLDSTHTEGDSIVNLGVGRYLEHARNYLNAFITDVSTKGFWSINDHYVQFGVKYQREDISDLLSEWKYVDSAGYSTNNTHKYTPNKVLIYSSSKADNHLITTRLSSYIQDSYNFELGLHQFNLTYGLRYSHNDYNNENLISPRLSTLITPDWEHLWRFRISTGLYYQSPFYRELRDFDGNIVSGQKSQRSYQALFGAYYSFKIWDRPFKFSTELYYKKYDNLIPYELDNLRIRYYANQKAIGYAVGADFKMYGEFVPGTDSWLSLSFLRTMEDIENDDYYAYYDEFGKRTYSKNQIADSVLVSPGYLPRPSDKLFSASIFFQDYIPGHSNFKVNLAFFFSTPVPFGPPQTARYRATLRSAKPYMRADIGFSFLLKSEQKHFKSKFFNAFKSVWGQFEIFNVMNISNIAAYNWLELVPNTSNPDPINYDMIAVPNHLTKMLLNLKLTFNF